MNLILLSAILTPTATSQTIARSCSLLPPGTESKDIMVVSDGDTSSNLKDELLHGQCVEHNIATWRNLSLKPQESPLLVFLLSESIQELVANLNPIGQLLTRDENSISEFWEPMFFVLWPTQTGDDAATFKTVEDVESYLRIHLAGEIRLDGDVFLLFPSLNMSSELGEHHTSSSTYEIFTSFDKTLTIRPLALSEGHTFEAFMIKSVRRQNLNGAVLKVVGLDDPDFIEQCNLEIVNGAVFFVSGLAVELLFGLQHAMNFSYFGVKGEGWIEQLENGSWIGMARQVRAGEADLSISLSAHLLYRFKGVGFLHPIGMSRIRVFFRQPPVSSIRDIFLSPFKVEVWALLGLLWLLFTSSMWALHWVQIRQGQRTSADKCMREERFFWCLRTFCQKSAHICPVTTSLRVVFISSLFIGGIYYVAYCASLVSTLSVKPVPIKTVEELGQSDLVILGDFWLPNNREIVQTIAGGRSGPQTPDEERYLVIDNAIPKLLSSPTAFVTFADGFMTAFHRFNYSDRYFCDTFSNVNPTRAPISSGMFVRRGSPLKELINPKILMMWERGINTRLNQHYELQTSAQCTEKRTRLGQSLQVSDIFTAYFLIGGGLALSLALSGLEHFTFQCTKGTSRR